ncbi:MAG: hypothetical protein ACF8TS_21075 [Maioricimonas sp. JB049]
MKTDSPDLLQLLERAIVALETIAAGVRRPEEPPEDADNFETRALVTLATVGPNLSEIARRLGCSRNKLRNRRRFMDLFESLQGVPRGYRTIRGEKTNGTLEAWEGQK